MTNHTNPGDFPDGGFAPVSGANPLPQGQNPDSLTPEEKNKKNKIATWISLGVVAAIGTGIALGLLERKNEQEEPNPTPTEQPSESPSFEPNPDVTISPEVPAFDYTYGFDPAEGLSAEQYTTPEEVVKAARGIGFNAWYTAGITPTLAEESKDKSETRLARELAAENRPVFADALLVSNWQDNPNLVKLVDNAEAANENVIHLNIITSNRSGSVDEDIEPYRRWSKIVDILEIDKNTDGTEFTVVYTVKEGDNADMNRVGEGLTNGDTISYETRKTSERWVVEDGQWVLADKQDLGKI